MPRAIDADALKNKLKELPGRYARSFAGKACLMAIDNAQTLDCEPVNRSRWNLYEMNPHRVTVDGFVVCPECKHNFDRIKGTWFKRCPNCGAMMEEDGK